MLGLIQDSQKLSQTNRQLPESHSIALKICRKRLGRKTVTGRKPGQILPAQAAAWGKNLVDHELPHALVAHIAGLIWRNTAQNLATDGMMHLRRKKLAQQQLLIEAEQANVQVLEAEQSKIEDSKSYSLLPKHDDRWLLHRETWTIRQCQAS